MYIWCVYIYIYIYTHTCAQWLGGWIRLFEHASLFQIGSMPSAKAVSEPSLTRVCTSARWTPWWLCMSSLRNLTRPLREYVDQENEEKEQRKIARLLNAMLKWRSPIILLGRTRGAFPGSYIIILYIINVIIITIISICHSSFGAPFREGLLSYFIILCIVIIISSFVY